MFKLLKPNAVFPQQGTISFLIDAKIDRGPGPTIVGFCEKMRPFKSAIMGELGTDKY